MLFMSVSIAGKQRKKGYDDDYFHRNVIPKMICSACGKTAPSTYRPRGTKYSADTII